MTVTQIWPSIRIQWNWAHETCPLTKVTSCQSNKSHQSCQARQRLIDKGVGSLGILGKSGVFFTWCLWQGTHTHTQHTRTPSFSFLFFLPFFYFHVPLSVSFSSPDTDRHRLTRADTMPTRVFHSQGIKFWKVNILN